MAQKLKLEPGRIYFGPDEARVMLVSLNETGDQALVQHPLSLRMETWPISRLHDHAAASSRRTYDVEGPKGPERRTKIAVRSDGSVHFKNDFTRREHIVSADDWGEWRAKAK